MILGIFILLQEMKRPMADGQWPMADGQWSKANGQKLMADRRRWYMIAKRMKDMMMVMMMVMMMMIMGVGEQHK